MTISIYPKFCRVTSITIALVIFTALAFVLIALGVIPVGDLVVKTGGDVIVYVAAGCYLIGGLLILSRRSWQLVIGANIIALVVFFFRMYQDRPSVMFSAGG